jgi:uncharacterized protein
MSSSSASHSLEIAKAPPIELFQLVTDQWTKPFWDAAAAHRLVASRCGKCRKFRMPPTPFCPACNSQNIDWVPLSGKGTVYSYTTIYRGMVPGLEKSLPYVVAVVALPDADGVRLISNLVGVPVSNVEVGAKVRVIWDDRADGVTVPRFELDL